MAKPLVTNPPGGAPTASYPAATTTRETGVREPAAGYSATAAPAAVSAPSAAQPQPAPQATQQPGPQAGQQPGQQPQPSQQHGGPRTARLTVANVDPWSVLKLSFLLSVALGIALVVASIVLWSVLNGMGVFDSINSVLGDIGGAEAGFDIYAYAGFGRVVSLSTVIGVVNVVLITALATVGAFLYNLSAGLVGGLHITLSDD